MLKKTVKFTDFNGDVQEETLYFNLSSPELIELEVSMPGGMKATMERIIEAKDAKALIVEFKRLILAAYGQKSEDGRSFVKTPALAEAFSQTAAYQALFMELATNEIAAAEFVTGVLPSELIPQDKPLLPPPAPKSVSNPANLI